jgi:lysine 2,3-aminomutase
LQFSMTASEQAGFESGEIPLFEVRTTPYYAALASGTDQDDPIRKMLMPRKEELHRGAQAMLDPLGERKNNPSPRIVHRYPDRALFLITDFCSVYCRYCTRKHFTGGEQAFAKPDEFEAALQYLRRATGVREVILSGGDPLTLSDEKLDRVVSDLRKIDHIEIIRVGTRMPVVCPMRVTDDLVRILKKAKPVFLMTHFNHPRELTAQAAAAVELFVDNGIPVFNQMVLLNGVNNDARIVQALSRRLLFLRAKPYYMFQCDPSFGTDHLRTSVEESLEIQAELWGNLSGLAMPTLSLDIPDGGGKATLVPEFEKVDKRLGDREAGTTRSYRGWDGVESVYKSPPRSQRQLPIDAADYQEEWNALKRAKSKPQCPDEGQRVHFFAEPLSHSPTEV